ncbi:MAG: hypothetical protein J7L23_03380 [Candidatus Diapherotrites archaeon]|nr:hypothetical protein [Candidatus Diapherotrites archaeon]
MTGPIHLQEKLALEKFENMNAIDKYRVIQKINELARDKGYNSEKELKEQRPFIWNQLCAQAVDEFNTKPIQR